MKNKTIHPPSVDAKLVRLITLVEQLIAIQLYIGGATQPEIADNLDMSVGKVNSLVKGVRPPREKHGKK